MSPALPHRVSAALHRAQPFMERSLVPMATRLLGSRHLSAVRNGITALMPVTLIGGLALMLAMPPVPPSMSPSNGLFALLIGWRTWAEAHAVTLLTPYHLSIGIISVYVVCSVSFALASSYKMDGPSNALAAMLVFFVASDAFDAKTLSVSITRLGAENMFSAMLIGLLVVEVNRLLARYGPAIRLPETVPPSIAAPFSLLTPLALSVVGIVLLNGLLIALTGSGLTGLIGQLVRPLLAVGDSLPSVLFFTALTTTLWFFGMHGTGMVSSVVTPIATAALTANLEAYRAGRALPFVFAGMVNSVFGNWIAYAAIVAIMLVAAKSSQLRNIAKVAAMPCLFNINEPVIFGMPTVLNVFTYIPLLACSALNYSAYYALAAAGVVGRFYLAVPFTVPVPLQAFLSTMDWKTIPLVMALFLADLIVCLPFVLAYDDILAHEECRDHRTDGHEAPAAAGCPNYS